MPAKPVRLRRVPPDAAPPAITGLPTRDPVLPDPRDPQVLRGTSNEAANKSAGVYADQAFGLSRGGQAPATIPTPFALRSR